MKVDRVMSRRAFLRGRFESGLRIGEGCLAKAGIVCRSCGDACPEAAIRFRPRLGGPAWPALDAGACIGCGDCVDACPVGAVTAPERVEVADDRS